MTDTPATAGQKPGPAKTQTKLMYAGAAHRFAASIIDSIALALLLFLLAALTAKLGTGAAAVFKVAVALVYFTAFESSKLRASPGKMVMGVYIGDLAGRRISPPRALARYVACSIFEWPKLFVTASPSFQATAEKLNSLKANPTQIQTFFGSPEFMTAIQPFLLALGLSLVAGIALIWLPMVFTKQKTGIHDILSQSRAFRKED
jgi:uncharacterized RDD family membrane protein YckC